MESSHPILERGACGNSRIIGLPYTLIDSGRQYDENIIFIRIFKELFDMSFFDTDFTDDAVPFVAQELGLPIS